MGTSIKPSLYQERIFQFVNEGRGDGVVSAVAGSGKTTTLVEISKLIGSQRAVFFAFNKHIAEALGARLGENMEAKTIHSAGMRALRNAYGTVKVDRDKYKELIEKEIRKTLPYLDNPEMAPRLRSYVYFLSKVIDMARLTLTKSEDDVMAMIMERNIDPGEIPWDEVEALVGLVRPTINAGLQMAKKTGSIDFTDMIFIPVHLNLSVFRYDWVLVDEAQDLNTCQRKFVLMSRAPGGRMIFVGDPRQAIMAFAGADAASYELIATETQATELPLSICYRCPTSHVNLAKMIVPQIEPREGAPEGTIIDLKADEVVDLVQEGDLLICRTTAPLISLCIKLIRNRIPARVRGRDIAEMLIKRAKEIAKKGPWSQFLQLLEEYKLQQIEYLSSKKNPSQTQIQLIEDICASLEACYTEFAVGSIKELCSEIEGIFSEDRASVWLSTIHRPKGLEAERVFIVNFDMLPFRMKNQSPDQMEQELNLKYVALTRSLDTLFLVNSGTGGKKAKKVMEKDLQPVG
jgi:superfamily I DNA/RNA helicase